MNFKYCTFISVKLVRLWLWSSSYISVCWQLRATRAHFNPFCRSTFYLIRVYCYTICIVVCLLCNINKQTKNLSCDGILLEIRILDAETWCLYSFVWCDLLLFGDYFSESFLIPLLFVLWQNYAHSYGLVQFV